MAISLRSDFDAASVRVEARASRDPDQVRRLLALASIYDGKSSSEAARAGDVTLQGVRDWVLSFNAQVQVSTYTSVALVGVQGAKAPGLAGVSVNGGWHS